MVIWLILFIVLAFLAVYAERILAVQRGQPPVFGPLSDQTEQVVLQIQGASKRVLQSPYEELAPQFKDWTQVAVADDTPLKAWLLNLPPQSMNALLIQLGQFLDELNIELAWLLEPEEAEALEIDPALKQAITQMVIRFCEACRQTVDIQPHLAEVRRYTDALSRLTEHDSRHFTRQLLNELHRQDLLQEAEPNMIEASEADRRAYVQHLVKQASLADPQRFEAIVKNLLAKSSA